MPKPTKNIRKLTKLAGHSIAVILPIELVRELNWKERQKVVVRRSGKKVIIEDWPVRRSLGKGGPIRWTQGKKK